MLLVRSRVNTLNAAERKLARLCMRGTYDVGCADSRWLYSCRCESRIYICTCVARLAALSWKAIWKLESASSIPASHPFELNGDVSSGRAVSGAKDCLAPEYLMYALNHEITRCSAEIFGVRMLPLSSVAITYREATRLIVSTYQLPGYPLSHLVQSYLERSRQVVALEAGPLRRK